MDLERSSRGKAQSNELDQKRRDLTKFLNSKSNFNAAKLLEMVQTSVNMYEEEILLLMKDNRSEEALEKYVENEQFEKAEEFCENNNEGTGLLT